MGGDVGEIMSYFPYCIAGEIFGSLCNFDFEISILSLSTLICFPLDVISKCVGILSKPTEPKVSFASVCKTLRFCFLSRVPATCN